jgi:hypothetical protein
MLKHPLHSQFEKKNHGLENTIKLPSVAGYKTHCLDKLTV